MTLNLQPRDNPIAFLPFFLLQQVIDAVLLGSSPEGSTHYYTLQAVIFLLPRGLWRPITNGPSSITKFRLNDHIEGNKSMDEKSMQTNFFVVPNLQALVAHCAASYITDSAAINYRSQSAAFPVFAL